MLQCNIRVGNITHCNIQVGFSSTCARIGRKPEGDDRRSSDVLGLAEGDEDVSWLDVQVRKLLLVQVLQASGYLMVQSCQPKLDFCNH